MPGHGDPRPAAPDLYLTSKKKKKKTSFWKMLPIKWHGLYVKLKRAYLVEDIWDTSYTKLLFH